MTNNSAFWDDDSINLEIVSRPSPSASGVYNINLTVIDQFKMVSIATESITISTSSFSGTQSSLDVKITFLTYFRCEFKVNLIFKPAKVEYNVD